MPVSQLWAVDVSGQLYHLSTAGQQWERCSHAQLDFKRVTAATQCCWAVACDSHIYLNVQASDLPIRYQEEAYENQPTCACLSVCLPAPPALEPSGWVLGPSVA